MSGENSKVTFNFVFLMVAILTAMLAAATFIFGIDRRVTVLESQSITSDKFYEKMEQQKKEIIEAFDKKFNELKKEK